MATATANGINVLTATISVPRVGVWRADLDLDAADASKVSGTIALVLGDVTWTGKATEVGAFVGRVKVRLLAGAAGFGKPTKPRFYQSIPAKTVVTDLLTEGGEKLSNTSDAGKLGTVLPFWTRHAGTVGEGLENVLDELGAIWRVLPDGTVYVGIETWPTSEPKDVAVETEVASESKIVFSSSSPSLLPGTTFRGRKVSRVEHSIDAGKTRTTAWYETGTTGTGDAFRSALDGLVRQATKHIDFFAVRSGKVVAQNANGTLEIKLDDADMPGMSKIPIAYGVPGISAKVKPGAKVHVQWADGSPTKPRAVVIDPADIIELQANTGMVKVSGASDFVALAKLVDDNFKKLAEKFTQHTHGSGVGPTTPPTVPLIAAADFPSVASKKLKTD